MTTHATQSQLTAGGRDRLYIGGEAVAGEDWGRVADHYARMLGCPIPEGTEAAR